jgi:N-acylneuraminate cytidylyltransferase
VPGKNTKLLAGKPLLQYTADAAKAAGLLTRVVLSSDDDAIIEVARQCGIDVPFKRPAHLATDGAPTLPAIQHAVQYLQEQEGDFFDAVCLLQPTSPMRPPGLIDACIGRFVSTGADSLITVMPVPHEYNPHWVFEPASDGFLKIATGEEKIIARRQELPPAYIRDGCVYITKTSVLMNQNSLYGSSIAWYETDPKNQVNIDTPDDWALAEQTLEKANMHATIHTHTQS